MCQCYNVSLQDAPDPQDVRTVKEGLRAYNRLHAPDDDYQPLTVFARTAERTLVGGLLGATYWGWLCIDVLWIKEGARRRGLGERLLVEAERVALRRGCRYAHVDTMSFQALPFYERHGYAVFGVLDDLPDGHCRYFLKKELRPG